MTDVAVAPLAAQNPDRAIALSATLALIVARWALSTRSTAAGGYHRRTPCHPLLVGYLAGGAVLMVVGQLGKVTGTSASKATRSCEEVRGFLGVATDTDWLTLAVAASTWQSSCCCAGWAVAARAAHRGGAGHRGIDRVRSGHTGWRWWARSLPGLPVPHLPEVTFEDVQMLLLAGLGITIVGYSDIMLIAGDSRSPRRGETADLRPDPQAEIAAMAGVHAMVGVFARAIRSPSGPSAPPWRSPVARA